MKLRAQLTLGWVDADKDHPLSAAVLHDNAERSQTSYENGLKQSLHTALQNTSENKAAIHGLEKLFRKRVKGSDPIKKFIGALANMESPGGYPQGLTCRIDAFAYSFLKGAKNFDLLLPCYKEDNDKFMIDMDMWTRLFADLAQFERFGKRSPSLTQDKVDDYRAMRTIFSRASARDEIRSIATLLISGPSTLQEVSEDLGLNYILGQRTLAAFETLNVVQLQTNKYSISTEKLPLVVFFLREVIGLDLISAVSLEAEVPWNN